MQPSLKLSRNERIIVALVAVILVMGLIGLGLGLNIKSKVERVPQEVVRITQPCQLPTPQPNPSPTGTTTLFIGNVNQSVQGFSATRGSVPTSQPDIAPDLLEAAQSALNAVKLP